MDPTRGGSKNCCPKKLNQTDSVFKIKKKIDKFIWEKSKTEKKNKYKGNYGLKQKKIKPNQKPNRFGFNSYF